MSGTANRRTRIIVILWQAKSNGSHVSRIAETADHLRQWLW